MVQQGLPGDLGPGLAHRNFHTAAQLQGVALEANDVIHVDEIAFVTLNKTAVHPLLEAGELLVGSQNPGAGVDGGAADAEFDVGNVPQGYGADPVLKGDGKPAFLALGCQTLHGPVHGPMKGIRPDLTRK